VFLSESKHFSVYNCDFLKHKYSRPASNYDGFLFASDLSSYTTCYPRPALGYLLPLTALSPAIIPTPTSTDPWTAAAPASTEFTVSSSDPTTTGFADLDFTQVRYDPECEAVQGTLAESPTTMEVMKFRIGVTETLALVGVQLDAIFNPVAPITYEVKNTDLTDSTYATIDSSTGVITISPTTPRGSGVVTVLMTDANGLRLFQNFRLVIAAQNPPTYKLPLQDISMTTGEVASQDVMNFNNPDVDGDPVSVD